MHSNTGSIHVQTHGLLFVRRVAARIQSYGAHKDAKPLLMRTSPVLHSTFIMGYSARTGQGLHDSIIMSSNPPGIKVQYGDSVLENIWTQHSDCL